MCNLQYIQNGIWVGGVVVCFCLGGVLGFFDG